MKLKKRPPRSPEAPSVSKAKRKAKNWLPGWERSFEAEFLCEDVRRQQRHYVFASFTIFFSYKASVMFAAATTPYVYIVPVAICLLLAYMTASKPQALWVDVAYSTATFAWLYYAGEMYKTQILPLPPGVQEADLLCAFMFTLMMMISMGHHPAVLLGWSLAVSTQCFMTNHADLQVNIIVLISLSVAMHTFLQSSHMKLREMRLASEAEISRIRNHKERQQQERLQAVRRSEQMQRVLTLVFHQVKAPLLLTKTELSRPGDAKDTLACAQVRIQQLWSLLSGVQREVQKQFPGHSEASPEATTDGPESTSTMRGMEAPEDLGALVHGRDPWLPLVQDSRIQLGVNFQSTLKLRWIRIELEDLPGSSLSKLLSSTDLLDFRRWLEPQLNSYASGQNMQDKQDTLPPFSLGRISPRKVEMLSAEPLAVVQLTGCVLAPADNLSIATS
ncbi:unnamed protein product [Effrenium voratum]|nr:unnamed protein product [Effrenium voratum]